ncbi:hypothetical protein [Thalassococcus sp. S3]|uniref:hypothetical protein n=1 Tax=Thalassococcus sp. S3 TaxID=2017482 RepID=UPI0010241907|nr:hypothetical protein [Thalassococcus sp. S3]QBF32366.1 hypothetical protein CFI11_14255 [Thalassococcus sp. S3]
MPLHNQSDITALKAYGSSLVQHLKGDYEDKIKDWKSALRNLGSAYATACKNHEAALTEAEKQRASRHDLYMSALSLACGMQVRWLGIALKNTKTIGGMTEASRDYLVGGIEDGTKYLADLGIKGIKSSLDKKMEPFNKHPQVFQNDLINNIEIVAKQIREKLQAVDEEMLRTSAWAETVLRRTNGNMAAAERATQQIVDELECRWLEKAHYYNHPPRGFENVIDMSRKIERQIWAQWVAKNMHAVERKEWGGNVEKTVQDYDNPEEAVLDRLEQLRVIKPASQKERDAIKKMVIEKGGTWDPNRVAPVDNFGWFDSFDDVKGLIGWAHGYKAEQVGGPIL